MNTTILKDKFYDYWFRLPHCKAAQKRIHNLAQTRINRDLIEDASIVSVNCVGGEISHALNMRFNSPFVNVSIARNDFVEMCCRFTEYMQCEMNTRLARDGSVVGTIGGGTLPLVTIRFPHDTDPQQVSAVWERRRERINYDKLIFIVDDQGLDEEHLKMFETINCFRKICLCSKDMSEQFPSCYLMKQYEGMTCTGKYQSKSFNGLHKFETMWDYVSFLNGD